ncbi:histidine kinase [Burkholderia vietnamiensis]|jgi:NO-binding membrane sensor protein with MHYT domain|uniref:histidine kinase n=1 Tax=Burkholderia TaxID=32008 RepID=UPI0005D927AC|nr:histidine kinase [Burkholderia vietnamiensis]AJY08584.1 his Kinase A domain protein [Burkholderia vietnamiensis LMG 10929]AVR14206.1 histidine kinase [Burkholderia vietnamiensis]KVE13541.1 histidine kinase [Burkholderia vietnamiensis]KVE70416.1 histidine kinase [Burkholderia vietnamiensis]KVM46580.1 histidine kinase [Burkholderia vietnamiensis]
MHGTYNLPLVLLSLVIATLASYTALDLAAFISLLEKRTLRRAWLAGGAVAMGTGIWSMHFVGMLALSLPIPLGYALTDTGASLAIAVLVSYFALTVVTRARLGGARLLAGGMLMGAGIVGMHYTGMAAMRMTPGIRYDPALFAASIGVAVIASTAALWMAQALRAQHARHASALRIGAALVMGIAITGMHYTAMAAAHFSPDARCGAANGIDAPWLATTIAMFTTATLTVTLLVCRFDARTTFLRGMTDTLERLVRVRTAELETALRRYEQTTAMLQRTRENMATEIDERRAAQARLEQEKDEQRRLLRALEDTHVQLLQSEKLASIGQLAAGVAHEINNPIGFISANLNTLRTWVRSLLDVLAAHDALLPQLEPAARDALAAQRRAADLDYVRDEIVTLIDESIDGAVRVRRIVQDLRDFSRPGSGEWSVVDLHAGLDSTLNVVHNELKYKADIVREYGDVPPVECLPSQLNQVFMNLLVNAAHAIPTRGVITIRTSSDGECVSIAISDTGTGMAPDVARRIFDPFFTTKPVGQGTGLGLSVSHGIVERHRGTIDVTSVPGQGTTFCVRLPIRRSHADASDATAIAQRA